MVWTPRVTVAAVVQQEDRFLLVEERDEGRTVYNQPAGHLEPGESLIQACVREVLEETAWRVRPRALVGIYRMHLSDRDTTYLRVCFSADCAEHAADRELDEDIVRVCWMKATEIRARSCQLRSPLGLRCLDDYLQGDRYPLELLSDLGDV